MTVLVEGEIIEPKVQPDEVKPEGRGKRVTDLVASAGSIG